MTPGLTFVAGTRRSETSSVGRFTFYVDPVAICRHNHSARVSTLVPNLYPKIDGGTTSSILAERTLDNGVNLHLVPNTVGEGRQMFEQHNVVTKKLIYYINFFGVHKLL